MFVDEMCSVVLCQYPKHLVVNYLDMLCCTVLVGVLFCAKTQNIRWLNLCSCFVSIVVLFCVNATHVLWLNA